MKLRHCLRRRITVPKFVVVLFFVAFLALTGANTAFGDDWDTCDCSTGGGPQEWIFTGDMPCTIGFVWCPNCEPDIAGYQIEYKIVSSEPTGIIGPDNWREPWPGVGIAEGDSPIKIWNPGKRPEGETGGVDLTDADRPEIRLSGLLPGQYYVFALRAMDTEGFMSGHSDENSGFTVCGPDAITDLIIKF